MSKNPEATLINLEAERAVLGSILIDNDVAIEVLPILKPADFWLHANGTIYEAMIGLFLSRTPIDLVTLEAALKGKMSQVSNNGKAGIAYLVELAQGTPNSVYGEHYADVVAHLAERRRLIAAARQVANLALDQDVEMANLREQSHGLILSSVSPNGRALQPVKRLTSSWLDGMEERLDHPGERVGIDTGYLDLDRLTEGLRPQQLVIVAGRPGMGKTALLLGMVDHMSLANDLRGVVFSLEMSADELINRMIARRLGVETRRLGRGELSEQEQERFYQAVGRLSEAGLWVDDRSGLTVPEMRALSMKAKALEGRLDYVMVDYLQLARMPGAEAGYSEVSQVARELKNLAKDLEVPVIAASQLNRGVEQRTDKRPLLSDLRESGQIEEAANIVALMYREGYYDPDTPKPNIAELHVAKHREGPTGRVELFWRPETASYFNLSKQEVRL